MNDLPNDMNIIIASYLKPKPIPTIEEKYDKCIETLKETMRQKVFEYCDGGAFVCEIVDGKMKLIFTNPDNLNIQDVDDLYNQLVDLWVFLDDFDLEKVMDYDIRLLNILMEETKYNCLCDTDCKQNLYTHFFKMDVYFHQ